MSRHDTLRRHATRRAGHAHATACPPQVSRLSLPALAIGMAWALALGPTPARAERLELSDISTGHGGFVIVGDRNEDDTLAPAGDVNGDGLDDVIVGTPDNAGEGRALVVFGKSDTTQVDMSDVAQGVGGFAIRGDFPAGWSVAGIGDINGDGLADVLVDEPAQHVWYYGKSYVVFGKTSTRPVRLENLEQAGGGGFVIHHNYHTFDALRIAAAGDVNGDGLGDLIIARPPQPGDEYFGYIYVVFGRTGSEPVYLADVMRGEGGYVINGWYGAGTVVAGVGDVNADGLADLTLGWTLDHTYVAFGKTDTAPIDIRDLEDGEGGFVIDGGRDRDYSGASAAGAGDVNGDGLADLILGAPHLDVHGHQDAGGAHVVFGKRTTEPVKISDISAGIGGFDIVNDAAQQVGGAVAAVGDVNGDGLADVVLGNSAEFGPQENNYVVFGRTGTDAVELSEIAKGHGGLAIHAEFGGMTAPVGGGDFNGDGLPDLLVHNPAFGSRYVIFGATTGAFSNTEVDRLRGPGDDTIVGDTRSNVFVGGAGDDTFVGNGGADVLYGGTGDDVFVLKAGNVKALLGKFGVNGNTEHLARLDGGAGYDTLRLVGAGVNLDLVKAANQGAEMPGSTSRIESVERIDLTGTGDNTLTIGVHDVQDLAGMNLINSGNQAALGWINGTYAFFPSTRRHQLVVDGDAGDVVNLGPAVNGWDNVGTVINHGVSYDVYNTIPTPAASFEHVQVIVAHPVTVVAPALGERMHH